MCTLSYQAHVFREILSELLDADEEDSSPASPLQAQAAENDDATISLAESNSENVRTHQHWPLLHLLHLTVALVLTRIRITSKLGSSTNGAPSQMPLHSRLLLARIVPYASTYSERWSTTFWIKVSRRQCSRLFSGKMLAISATATSFQRR